MQTKSTIQIIVLCIIVSASMLLSSCSTTMLSSNPHYHLNLVKADRTSTVTAKANIPATDIAPITQHGSLVAYTSDEQLNNLTSLLKSDIKQIEKQVKKSDPQVYKNIKNINITKAIKQMAIPGNKTSNAKVLSVNSTNGQEYDLMRDPTSLFFIWLILLGAAVVLLLLASAATVFYLLGFVVAVAFLIFFFLWILAAAKVPDRVS